MSNINNITPFEKRVKNAKTIGSFMSKYFCINNNNVDIDSFKELKENKRTCKHYSYSNLTSFYSNQIIEKGIKKERESIVDNEDDLFKKNKELLTIFKREKLIKKKVLNTIISMQSLECLEDINDKENNTFDYGLNPNKKTKKEITNYVFFSPQKRPNTSFTLLTPSPFEQGKPLLKPIFDNNQLSLSSVSKRDIKSDISKNALNALTSLLDNNTINNNIITEFKLRLFKETNYRRLLKHEYKIYDSCSDNEEEITIAFLIYPQSLFLFIWNCIILIVTLYYVLVFPFCLAFIQYLSLWMIPFEFISEFIFIVDIFIQFIIPIALEESQKEFNCNIFDIGVHYIYGWFWFDLLIAIPYCSIINYFYYTTNLTLNTTRSLLLIKLIKILKVLKLIIKSNESVVQEASVIDGLIPMKLKRLVKFFFYFIIFNHIIVCLWIFIGNYTYPNWLIKQVIQDRMVLHIYISAFYFTLASIYTVGYGDIYPTTTYERYLNIALQSIGLFLYAYVISSMLTVLKTSQKTIRFKHQCDILESVKVDYKVNKKLYFKIRKFLRHTYKLNHSERVRFLQELPNQIKNELVTHMHADLIRFELFHKTSIDFKTRVILCFKPACFSKAEIVIKRGDYIEDVVFIKRGLMEIEYQYQNQIIKLKKLHSRDHFGEVDMLLNHESRFDLVIKSKHAELLLLNKEHLITIGEEFPSVFNKIRKKSLIRFALLKLKLKEKIMEHNALMLKKCEKIIDFTNDNDNSNSDEDRSRNHSSGCNNIIINNIPTIKHDKQLTITPINEIIPEISLEEESDGKDINSKENNINENSLDSDCLEQEFNSIQPSSLRYRTNTKRSKKRITRINSMVLLKENTLPSSIENKQRKVFRSSEALFYFRPKDNSFLNANFNDQENKTSRFNSITKKSLDTPPQIDRQSESKIESLNSSRVIQRKSNKILRNIKESSMNINNPSQFYSRIFNKWSIDNQIKRIHHIWEVIVMMHNSVNTIKEK